MTEEPPYDVLPVDRIRRTVARRMLTSVTEKPHVTLQRSVDATALQADRRRISEEATLATGARVTLTVLLAHLVAHALREYPRINGRVEQEEIRLYHQINLGVAVALDDGLVAPVIRDADRKPLADIAAELAEKTERARNGKLSPLDLADPTFTMSNLGAFGVEYFTPIINPPQLGILGVGAVMPTVRIQDAVPVEVPMLALSLSFDHAVLDGAQAAQFLGIVAGRVEAHAPDANLPGGER